MKKGYVMSEVANLVGLSDEEADIIVHALTQTYLFDGWENAPIDDRDAVADIIVELGYSDPREEMAS